MTQNKVKTESAEKLNENFLYISKENQLVEMQERISERYES